MAKKSIKRNLLLNLFNTVSGLLFPLVTFPYASRILLAEGIGRIQFFQSILGYIALCTALGIPLYAVREIAKVRDNNRQCSKVVVEILLLHSVLTFFGYIIVFILVETITPIQIDVSLFLLLSVNLFFTAIGALWFFQGIEDFKYITIRALFIRICSLVGLFIFVKDKSDLLYYAAISVTAETGSNIFNFFRLHKFVNIHTLKFRELKPCRHLKPALKIFTLTLITSVYVNLDSVMLGFLKDEVAVGYYAAATRITKSILGVVQSLGTVLLPRFANLISMNQRAEFERLASKSISFVLFLSLPIVVVLLYMAAPIIHLFCGTNFAPSILVLQIMAPIILFIGLSGIMGMQILYVLGKENLVIFSVSIGAVSNFLLNMFLMPNYAQFGAAFATCIAELLVTVVMTILAQKYMPVYVFSTKNQNYFVAAFLVALSLSLLLMLNLSELYYLIIGIFLVGFLYILYLLWRKDLLVLQIKESIVNKIVNK